MLSPRFTKHFHGVMTALWFVMMPLALWQGWVASVVFISVISLYANFVSHFSSWQAARVEVRQGILEHERQQREDLPQSRSS